MGFDTSDDAAVYRVSPEIALISTVDYITPPVNDPYWFGQIAAANALSDVYAMGGKPLTALNLVMFPSQKLDLGFLKEILRGGSDKVREAEASMAGGHSVDDNEPKYGLAVTGSVHPERILTNCGSRVGDALILTKPLGTGVLFNANRSGKLPYSELEAILPRVAALNRKAIEVAVKFDVHACTDVTGFGITRHALELAPGGNVQIDLIYRNLPFYPNALQMYQKGETTGSSLDHIVESVNVIQQVNQQIAGAAAEQRIAAEDISRSIERINTDGQEIVSESQSMSDSAKSLAALSERLETLVSQFQT